MASRTAWLPTGTMLGRPPRITGFSVVELGGVVEPRCVRRAVDVDDGLLPLGHLVQHRLICLARSSSEISRSVLQGVYGTTPRLAIATGPRSHSSASGHSTRSSAAQHRVGLHRIVVAGVMMQRTAGSSRSAARSHQRCSWAAISLRKSRSRARGVGLQRGELIGLHPDRVEPGAG